jgi:hypothetical protein
MQGRGRGPARQAGTGWVDRFAGTLDEDFARGALDRPKPETSEQPDIA